MDLSAEIADDSTAVLDLEFLASEPYTRFVYSTVEQTLAVRQYLFARNLCEFSPPHLRVLRHEGRVVGMLAALTGADLAECRLRAALAITKSGLLTGDTAVSQRLRLAGQTLLKLGRDDFYLSRIATAEAARGKGLGELMIRATEREARERGCRRVALEVAPASEAAVRLYRREGFQQIDARQVSDSAAGRHLEYLHLAKSLDDDATPSRPGGTLE